MDATARQERYERLRAEAAACTRCDLFARATQTVFGEGSLRASILLVGEQPGDREDIEGHPFVGPAGRVLDDALEQAGIERDDVFISNVVKHFKWEPRGKRRIHQRPNVRQVRACLPWLEAEMALVSPRVLVVLGATAAKALLGDSFKVTEMHGRRVESPLAPDVLATIHPSAVLRQVEAEGRHEAFSTLVEDLRVARRLAHPQSAA
jgi:DNA polymerase